MKKLFFAMIVVGFLTAGSAWADDAAPGLPQVPEATRSDSNLTIWSPEIGPAKVHTANGTFSASLLGVARDAGSGFNLGEGAALSVHKQVGLIETYKDQGLLGAALILDLGADGQIEFTQKGQDGKQEMTDLSIRSAGLSLGGLSNRSSYGVTAPGHEKEVNFTLDARFGTGHYVYQDDRIARTGVNGAEISVGDVSMHGAFTLNGLPMEICSAFSASRFIVGKIQVQNDSDWGEWAPEASLCLGVELGQHVTIRNTSRVGYTLGNTKKLTRITPDGDGNPVETTSYYGHSNVNFANTTGISVSIDPVKLDLGYTFAYDHFSGREGDQTNVVSHHLMLGVSAF